MRLKVSLTTIFLASFLFLFSVSPVLAAPCAPGVASTTCEPPTLPQLEQLSVQVIGFVWVITGIVFFAIFVYNGYLYMFNKVEDAKKRMMQWIIGLLLILFSQPLITTVMRTMISDQSECYASLREPTFTFFFPQVCTTK